MSDQIKVADEVWFATALLQYRAFQEKKDKNQDFGIKEIVGRVFDYFSKEANILDWKFRPGVIVHVNLHCVANKRPNPNTLCYLVETKKARRRLFRKGDDVHEWRINGRTHPDLVDIPPSYPQEFKDEFKKLLKWYFEVYSK